MLLKDAMDIAMPIWESLKPVCDIRKIAGSLRREKPEPKDIEIVCLPKVVVLKDMFGWDEGTIRVHEDLFNN
jgi:DNA polymerase/3'-5' exonuclease PolX